MFSQENGLGLSLDQAPPVSVIYAFFFSGAIFGIIAGISLFFYGTDIYDPSTSAAITFTHLLALGVMLSFMFAALFQMLPVLAGVKLTSPVKRANLLLYPFIFGLLSLLVGFNSTESSLFYIFAAILLGVSILASIIPMLLKLFALKNHTSSSKGILVTLLSLIFVLLLAFYLLLTLAGHSSGTFYASAKIAHYSFGLFGWIALLIISISFQVIEMFYVTPPYPKSMTKYLPLSILTLLVIATIVGLFEIKIWEVVNVILGLMLMIYALLTLKRFTQKKRPLSDATIRFWQTGLLSLVFSMFFMFLGKVVDLGVLHSLRYIFFANFALSIVFAMFYKIIPFITWFHLNSQGFFNAPMMHQVISPKTAQKHFYIHLVTLASFFLSVFFSPFIYIAALLTMLSFGWVAYLVIHAHTLYKKTKESGKKFGRQP